MRIVHVVVTDAYAGVESHVARLARGQAAAGHQVIIVGGKADQVRRAAGSVVTVLPGRTVRGAVKSLNGLATVPDVVHAHMTAAETACILYGPVLVGRVPLISTRHFAFVRGRSLKGGLAARLIRNRVSAQIAISDYTAAHIDGPSVVVLAGVDSAPDVVAAADREPVVLMAQRLEPEKRADLGIRAFAGSGLKDQGWCLRVAGDGSERPSIERLVHDLDLTNSTEIMGHRDDVSQLMARASIFLAPTPGEHFGLSVLEAMAAGLPVVADRSGGHIESLGAVGDEWLYLTGDAGAAGDRLGLLASDISIRSDYGAALHERQEAHFSLKAQVEATLAVYGGILGSP